MTRFARAKGSKASNDRIPDESTPWHVMKQQLEDSVESKKICKGKKSKTATVLLRERADEPYYGATNMNHDWAEFPQSEKNTASSSSSSSSKDKKFKKSLLVNDENIDSALATFDHLEKKSSNVAIQKSIIINEIPKVQNRGSDLEASVSTMRQKQQMKNEGGKGEGKRPIELKKSIQKRKRKQDVTSSSSSTHDENLNIEKTDYENTPVVVDDDDKPTTVKLSKRQKRNRKNKAKLAVLDGGDNDNPAETKESGINKVSTGTFNAEGNEWSTDVKFGYHKKQFITSNDNEYNNQAKISNYPPDSNYCNNPNDDNNSNTMMIPQRFNNKCKIIKKRKPPKIRDDKGEHKRKKPHPGSTKVIINGIQVEIVMYDGFPIKKEDADRLKELRQQMVMKAIPKSEIDIAMKLERRKAEKNLARVKKNVCFHCRKSGHNLSDCPDLGKEEAATGICFKCGSTEHTHFQCKINKKEEFGYAKCFICREQGHIAKQCPDNPKGLYPNGGACKICGDVTHLKKDCPDFLKEKEETALVLNTINYDIIDNLECEEEKQRKEEIEKVKNKIVKF